MGREAVSTSSLLSLWGERDVFGDDGVLGNVGFWYGEDEPRNWGWGGKVGCWLGIGKNWT